MSSGEAMLVGIALGNLDHMTHRARGHCRGRCSDERVTSIAHILRDLGFLDHAETFSIRC